MKSMLSCLLLGGLVLFSGAALAEERAPDPLAGLMAQVAGIVQGRGANSFLIKVNRIVQVLPGNQAKDPTALEGKTIWVFARLEKDANGLLKPSVGQVDFMNKVSVNQEVTVSLANPESVQKYEMTDRIALPAALKTRSKGEGVEDDKDDQEKELKRLRLELHRLKQEVNELKKAAAKPAGHSGPP